MESLLLLVLERQQLGCCCFYCGSLKDSGAERNPPRKCQLGLTTKQRSLTLTVVHVREGYAGSQASQNNRQDRAVAPRASVANVDVVSSRFLREYASPDPSSKPVVRSGRRKYKAEKVQQHACDRSLGFAFHQTVAYQRMYLVRSARFLLDRSPDVAPVWRLRCKFSHHLKPHELPTKPRSLNQPTLRN